MLVNYIQSFKLHNLIIIKFFSINKIWSYHTSIKCKYK